MNMKKVDKGFVWEEFNVKQIETKHNLTAQAKIDGTTENPKTNSDSYSVLENELSGECSTYLEKNTNKLGEFLLSVEEEQNKLSSHLENNHFEPIVSKLSADFNTLANEKKIKLSDCKNSYDTYLEEKNTFKRYNQLSREPNSANLSKTLIAGSIIFLLLLIELFANTALLSPAMVGGKAEGLSIAGSVAFLNVFISAFVGFYVVKNINHIEKAKKTFYGVLGGAYFFIVIYINAALGAYRSQAEISFNKTIAGDSGLSPEQMSAILRNSVKPWSVDFSFLGLVLTFIGIAFAFIAIVDGLTFNDSYPGYGKVGQKVNLYKELIKKTFHEYAKEVASLFSRSNKELQNKLTELLNKDLNNWDSNTNLIQKEFIGYVNKVKDLEEKTKHMIGEYRNENKRVRKTEAPEYFQSKFSIDPEKKDPKKVFEATAFHFMNDETRQKTKLKFSNLIKEKFSACELLVENIQKKSEETQKKLHETYNL